MVGLLPHALLEILSVDNHDLGVVVALGVVQGVLVGSHPDHGDRILLVLALTEHFRFLKSNIFKSHSSHHIHFTTVFF